MLGVRISPPLPNFKGQLISWPFSFLAFSPKKSVWLTVNVRWFKESGKGQYFLFRLAQSTGVILLPGKGFDTVHASVRVSLANLTHHEYELIGRETRKVLDEHFAEYNAQ